MAKTNARVQRNTDAHLTLQSFAAGMSDSRTRAQTAHCSTLDLLRATGKATEQSENVSVFSLSALVAAKFKNSIIHVYVLKAVILQTIIACIYVRSDNDNQAIDDWKMLVLTTHCTSLLAAVA